MKQKELTKKQALVFLQERKHILKIAVVGKEVKAEGTKPLGRRLDDIVSERKDQNGNTFTLADKYLPSLLQQINFIKGK